MTPFKVRLIAVVLGALLALSATPALAGADLDGLSTNRDGKWRCYTNKHGRKAICIAFVRYDFCGGTRDTTVTVVANGAVNIRTTAATATQITDFSFRSTKRKRQIVQDIGGSKSQYVVVSYWGDQRTRPFAGCSRNP